MPIFSGGQFTNGAHKALLSHPKSPGPIIREKIGHFSMMTTFDLDTTGKGQIQPLGSWDMISDQLFSHLEAQVSIIGEIKS